MTLGKGRLTEKSFWIALTGVGIFSWILHALWEVDEKLLLVMVAMVAGHTLQEIIEERPGMEHVISTLMSLVGLITYMTGLHFEGVMLLTFYGLAEILESYSMERAESDIKELVEYMPRKARVKRDKVEEVPYSEIREGDLVIVPSGERVPVDGLVIQGDGLVDQSVVTGEPLPVKVSRGDFVYSGSLLIEGSITVKAVNVGEKSFISRVLKMVEEFRGRKSRRERRIHTFSKYYLPAMLLAVIPVYLSLGLKPALVLLATACPSAFLIAASSTNLAALSRATKKGVLFKGSPPLEVAPRVKFVALDKTGTLTLGRLKVREANLDDEVLSLLASIELASRHPIAEAVVREARNRGLNLRIPEYVKEVPGSGISGVVDGHTVVAGKPAFLGVDGAEGRVYVKVDGQIKGYLEFEEEVDPSAEEVVKKLQELGLEVMIISGDKEERVKRIAKELNVKGYHELKPEDKVKIVEELRRKGPVAMVGDGINDAPALAASDLGVAVGGLEASMEAGDVALISGIRNLPWVFEAGRLVKDVFWQNVALIALSKLIAIALGVVGYIPLWAAVAVGDDGGLIMVALNIAKMLRRMGHSTSTSLKDSQRPWRLQ